jgi:hypothetical protein
MNRRNRSARGPSTWGLAGCIRVIMTDQVLRPLPGRASRVVSLAAPAKSRSGAPCRPPVGRCEIDHSMAEPSGVRLQGSRTAAAWQVRFSSGRAREGLDQRPWAALAIATSGRLSIIDT